MVQFYEFIFRILCDQLPWWRIVVCECFECFYYYYCY